MPEFSDAWLNDDFLAELGVSPRALPRGFRTVGL